MFVGMYVCFKYIKEYAEETKTKSIKFLCVVFFGEMNEIPTNTLAAIKQQIQRILTHLVAEKKRQQQSLMSSFLLPLNLVDCEKSAKTFAKN